MPVPAHYAIVVGDETKTIAIPHTPIFADVPFDMPSDILALGTLDKAVFQILTHPSHDPENLQVNISINGTEIYNFGPTSETRARSFHTVFDGGILVPGRNTMRVARFGVGVTGAFGFSNVVIWYGQRLSRSPNPRPRNSAKKIAPRRTAKKAITRKKKRIA